jgi:magnesium-transporting ATPase (P-type)
MTVSMSLAFSYQKMFTRDNILVRDLKSIEKMGQINEVLTLLTGTFITEQMTVDSF